MMRPILRFTSLVAVFGVFASLGGCALVKERAEALYMRQQGAQSDLADTVASVEIERPALAERLYRLEDELHSACGSLREAGLRRFEGEALGSRLELAVATSLDRCESTTGAVEREIQQALAGEGNEIADLGSALGRDEGQ
jgi:hypothetical protein